MDALFLQKTLEVVYSREGNLSIQRLMCAELYI